MGEGRGGGSERSLGGAESGAAPSLSLPRDGGGDEWEKLATPQILPSPLATGRGGGIRRADRVPARRRRFARWAPPRKRSAPSGSWRGGATRDRARTRRQARSRRRYRGRGRTAGSI